MCFFRKKKKNTAPVKDDSLQRILGEALFAQPRAEKKAVGCGVSSDTKLPYARIKELGPTLLEDLGKDGAVVASYDEEKERLSLTLSYSYAKDSEEMKLIKECLDDIGDDEEDALPGDITECEIIYYTDDISDVIFHADDVEKAELREAADRLFGFVFDWLDIVYEAFEDEF